jgi:hypothetical protein
MNLQVNRLPEKTPDKDPSNLRIKQSISTNNKTTPFFAIIGKYLSVKAVFSLLNPPLSVITVALCFLPLLLMWWKGLTRVKAYLFIAIYWMANAIVNLPDCLGVQGNELQNKVILLYNLFDAPLALLIFYFSATGTKKQIILYLLLFIIVFEPVLVMWMGHNFNSSTIIIGVGGLLALFFSFSGLAEYFQKIEHTALEKAMGFVYAGFIFDYGLSIVTFFFNYLNYTKESLAANIFLYYLSLILAIILTSVGLWKHARPEMRRI